MKLKYMIATGFGVGYIPKAPGTFGSILGLLLSMLLVYFLDPSSLKHFVNVTFFLGLWASYAIIKKHRDMDPQFIIIDEVAGMALTLYLTYKILGDLTFTSVTLSFIFFRLFDIWKPWPINQIEEYLARKDSTASFGVMIDDILAAFYAAAAIAGISMMFTKQLL